MFILYLNKTNIQNEYWCVKKTIVKTRQSIWILSYEWLHDLKDFQHNNYVIVLLNRPKRDEYLCIFNLCIAFFCIKTSLAYKTLHIKTVYSILAKRAFIDSYWSWMFEEKWFLWNEEGSGWSTGFCKDQIFGEPILNQYWSVFKFCVVNKKWNIS